VEVDPSIVLRVPWLRVLAAGGADEVAADEPADFGCDEPGGCGGGSSR